MLPAARIGVDFVAASGVMGLGSPSVFINSIPSVLLGSPITSHEPCCCGIICACQEHCAAAIVSGSPTVFVNNLPAIHTTSLASCGHMVMTGSSNVFFN